ncbi:MAG: HAMP domain-containing histidine kinase [Moraxellaceae bacterium]|nr:HAMP domain-containing histidine kinase [Moraxellaceae bacterium]
MIQNKLSQSAMPSLSTYSLKYQLLMVLCSALLTVTIITAFGIHQSFVTQRKNAQEVAVLLSHSAGMSYGLGIELSVNQAEEILQDNPFIKDINLYSFQSQLEIADEVSSSLLIAFTQDSYNINQSISYQDNLDEILLKQLPNFDNLQANTATQKGYISIELDVKKIRSQWFQSQTRLYLSILLGYLFLFLGIYFYNKYVIKQAKKLQLTANKLSEVDKYGLITLPDFKQKIYFHEYNDIKKAFINLVERYNGVQKELNERDLEEENRQQETATNLQETAIQRIIHNELVQSVEIVNEGVQSLAQQYLLDEQKDALSLVRKGSQQMQFILEQIIYFEKIQNGQVFINRVEFNPLQLISDIIALFQVDSNKKNIELLSNITHMEYKLEGDIDKIQKIIKALVNNAIDFTDKGSVTIESHLQHFKHSTRWTVKIRDTGIGIEEPYLESIFEPFFQIKQEKHQGIGIGLTIAKQLAELMNAKLSVTSEFGKGSVFTLVIPLFDKTQLLERQYLQGITITCFQNDADEKLSSDLLESGAKEVRCYHNIDETLEILINKPTDVLIIASDVSYRQVLKLVNAFRNKETNHRILVVWLMNADMNVTDTQIQAMGVDFAVIVPFTRRELALSIKNWLR